MADASIMLNSAADDLNRISASLGDAAELTGGASDGLLGDPVDSPQPRGIQPSAAEDRSWTPHWPAGSLHTRHSWWSRDWETPPPDWEGGAWPPPERPATGGPQQPGAGQQPVTSMGDVVQAIDAVRQSLPNPRHLRDAADDIQLAAEQARFHPEFSIDHNHRAAEQFHDAAGELREIADTLERSYDRIDIGRDRIEKGQSPSRPRPSTADTGTLSRPTADDQRGLFRPDDIPSTPRSDALAPQSPRGPPSAQNPSDPDAATAAPTPTRKVRDPFGRPSNYRNGIRNQVWENGIRDHDGNVVDPNTGVKLNPDKWDMGHKDETMKEHQERARKDGISRKVFLDQHNDPSRYHPEDPSSNRSRKFDRKPDN